MRAWCRIVWRCWQDRTPYDPAKHRALQQHCTVTVPTSSGSQPDLAATQRMLGPAVTSMAARRVEREALDGKPTSAIPLRSAFVVARASKLSVAWLRLSGRDSDVVGSHVAALLPEQKTAEPGDGLLRFVQLDNAETDELRARNGLQRSGAGLGGRLAGASGRLPMSAEQAEASGVGRGLAPCADAQLAEDRGDVVVDGPL